MRSITTLILVLLAMPVLAEDDGRVSLLTSPFNEIVRPEAIISGSSFMGLVARSDDTLAAGAPEISAWLPAEWAGDTACLHVISSDGLYESLNSYGIAADWEGGQIELPYPSRSGEELRARQQIEIALALTRGQCGTEGSEATLAFWSDRPLSSLTLLVNTFRAQEVLVYVDGRPEVPPVACQPAEAEIRTAFDMVCTLPPEWFEGAALQVTLLPVKNGEIGQETRLSLRAGPLE
jgi:hypothetical protein